MQTSMSLRGIGNIINIDLKLTFESKVLTGSFSFIHLQGQSKAPVNCLQFE